VLSRRFNARIIFFTFEIKTMRIYIQGIAFVLPRDNKLTKTDISKRYGKGSHFNLPKHACDKVHDDLQQADKERKEAAKLEKEKIEQNLKKFASEKETNTKQFASLGKTPTKPVSEKPTTKAKKSKKKK
jgi:hypothetical protein